MTHTLITAISGLPGGVLVTVCNAKRILPPSVAQLALVVDIHSNAI